MSTDKKELKKVQELSQRLVDAQRTIRILDSIKWDDSIKQAFFQKKGRELPQVTLDYYQKKPLPFDTKAKQEEFRIRSIFTCHTFDQTAV